MNFLVDDAARTVMSADGTALVVTRFDDNRISASRDNSSYEFERRDGTVSYATATTEGRVTTVIVGSGQCQSGPSTQ
jgi:hypothetical protein